MAGGTLRRTVAAMIVVCALVSAACGGRGVFKKQFEYEEEVFLSLDGSATVNVNASVPALVALRGADLTTDPAARLDRARVRALFTGPGVTVERISLSRREGRRFVHVGLAVEDIRYLSRVTPFAWSTYRLDRSGDLVTFAQHIGPAAGRPVDGVGWTGDEVIGFRLHIPSRIPSHNSPDDIQRGNILEWQQSLADRRAGKPLDLEVQMEPRSILYSTLILFGSTIIAAALTFAGVLWWVVRRGGKSEMVESRP